MNALRVARRANGHDVNGYAVGDAAIIAVPIDENTRVLGYDYTNRGGGRGLSSRLRRR